MLCCCSIVAMKQLHPMQINPRSQCKSRVLSFLNGVCIRTWRVALTLLGWLRPSTCGERPSTSGDNCPRRRL